ncbi:MAG TPA: ATP-binding protein [Solirubrobacteraceae bacterium]|jgi:hypothetical protein|nr:ATP-binding protein [Solirubrobacteraceae bacterium]
MRDSPYTPGAGHSPEVLAGREVLLGSWREMLTDLTTGGRVRAKDIVMTGPRGIGKTATLTEFHKIGEEHGFDYISLQAVAGRGSLVDGLAYHADRKIHLGHNAWQHAKSALERITGVTLGTGAVTLGFSLQSSGVRPLPDASVFAQGLAELASQLAKRPSGGGLLFSIDELQVADPTDLALLAGTLQRLNVDHATAAVAFAATGLSNTSDALDDAQVTHPDRLFDIRPIPLQLTEDEARYAVAEPARRHNVLWDDGALEQLVAFANRYPAHLQLAADAAWTIASGPGLISQSDVEVALPVAKEEIERRTLEPSWTNTTDRQAELLGALAVNGGYVTTQQMNATLGRDNNEWAVVRRDLINQGTIYAPRRARLAFTVPTFTPYVLANYEDRRLDASVPLLSLAAMKQNAAKDARGD